MAIQNVNAPIGLLSNFIVVRDQHNRISKTMQLVEKSHDLVARSGIQVL